MEKAPMTLKDKIISAICMVISTFIGLCIISVAVVINFFFSIMNEIADSQEQLRQQYAVEQEHDPQDKTNQQ